MDVKILHLFCGQIKMVQIAVPSRKTCKGGNVSGWKLDVTSSCHKVWAQRRSYQEAPSWEGKNPCLSKGSSQLRYTGQQKGIRFWTQFCFWFPLKADQLPEKVTWSHLHRKRQPVHKIGWRTEFHKSILHNNLHKFRIGKNGTCLNCGVTADILFSFGKGGRWGFLVPTCIASLLYWPPRVKMTQASLVLSKHVTPKGNYHLYADSIRFSKCAAAGLLLVSISNTFNARVLQAKKTWIQNLSLCTNAPGLKKKLRLIVKVSPMKGQWQMRRNKITTKSVWNKTCDTRETHKTKIQAKCIQTVNGQAHFLEEDKFRCLCQR